MPIKIPTHCDCGAELVLHCANENCQWLRCPNANCVWCAWDVARGRRLHRKGYAEQTPA